jgi:hypothetical protein
LQRRGGLALGFKLFRGHVVAADRAVDLAGVRFEGAAAVVWAEAALRSEYEVGEVEVRVAYELRCCDWHGKSSDWLKDKETLKKPHGDFA